ncbi:MAG: hypothetical protein HBSAPP03_17610 [Phycisphaerae bacterium]|nr:MAG: hypothetical protein HBSAPP03_17610 [Phycisphaerae bacterium]
MSTPTMVPPPDVPWTGEPERKGWLSRNAVWVVIASVVLVVGVGITCAGGFVWAAMRVFRDHPATQEALTKVEADPRVAAIVGTPLTPGWMVQGNIGTTGGVTTLNVRLPVTGPKGSGVIRFSVTDMPGSPRVFTSLQFVVDNGGAVIDVMKPTAPVPEEVTPPGGP